jgi:hypothetical protein
MGGIGPSPLYEASISSASGSMPTIRSTIPPGPLSS